MTLAPPVPDPATTRADRPGGSIARSAAAPSQRRLDPIDSQIVAMLRANARLPLKTVAGTVGLARSSVRERLSRLEAEGVILGYHARVAATDQVSAILHLALERTPSPAVVSAVTGMAEVVRCYSLSGPIDLAVEIAAPTPAALNAARDRIATLPGVASVVTAMILSRDKDG